MSTAPCPIFFPGKAMPDICNVMHLAEKYITRVYDYKEVIGRATNGAVVEVAKARNPG